MSRRVSSREGCGGGFTIVEMLTVVAIIALLMGMLLPALSGAKKTSQKLKELSALRQIGVAWHQYAFSQGDAALPGFLEPGVQEAWNAQYEFIDGSLIPPAPAFDMAGENLAGPWTWRLLPYLDYNHQMIHGYVDEVDFDRTSMTAAKIDPDELLAEEAKQIAFAPGFGYNAIYVGGWWEMTPVEGAETEIPRYKFYDATADLDGDSNIGSKEYARVVVRSVSQIRRSTELVIFCSSSDALEPGTEYENVRDDLSGAHWISPSRLPRLGDADNIQWTVATVRGSRQSEGIIEVVTKRPVPIGRYTGNVAVLYADSHTGAVLPGKLADQRAFIDIADKVGFEHQ